MLKTLLCVNRSRTLNLLRQRRVFLFCDKMNMSYEKGMLKMSMEHQLYEATKNLIEQRYPTGWGGAAAIRVEDGTIYNKTKNTRDFSRGMNRFGLNNYGP